jgi:hypothetical protein
MNNQNVIHQVVVNIGSPSVDATGPALYADVALEILSVHVANGAAIAASDTDYASFELLNGADIVAELDTRAAHENGLADKVFKGLNLVAAKVDVAAGSSLSWKYNETDAGTNIAATNAQMVIKYRRKGNN